MSGTSPHSTHNGVVGRVGRVGSWARSSQAKPGVVANGGSGAGTGNGTPVSRANGHGTPSSAGAPHLSRAATAAESANGSATMTFKDDDAFCGLDREQTTRLMIQALSTTYPEVAENLKRESGYEVDAPIVGYFRKTILEGIWDQAEALVLNAVVEDRSVAGEQQSPAQQRHEQLVLVPTADPRQMLFRIREQKYLEVVERDDTRKALDILRNEIVPVCPNTRELHLLSAQLMASSPEELRSGAYWGGAAGSSRAALLDNLFASLAPSILLPRDRLFTLLREGLSDQIRTCKYHTAVTPLSLYHEHECPPSEFPDTMALTLRDMPGEVYKVRFSNNGAYLAAGGDAGKVTVWNTRTWDVKQVFKVATDAVTDIAWGPNDSLMVVTSMDCQVRLLNMETGALVWTSDKHHEPTASAAWHPSGDSFLVATLDKRRGLQTMSVLGASPPSSVVVWPASSRSNNVVVSPDGHFVITADHKKALTVWDPDSREELFRHQFESRASGLTVSRDSRQVLVNCRDSVVFLFDLYTREIVRSYAGSRGQKQQIGVEFGGPDEDYVLAGSEDGKVLVWQRHTGQLVLRLLAHDSMCSTVAWHPSDPAMFVTGGDDGTVKIWTSQKRAETIRVSHP